MGIFAVLFLNYYSVINTLSNKLLRKVPHWVKIFGVLILTLTAGLVSTSYISTGHELILSLTEKSAPVLILITLILVRSTLTLLANTNKITGGIFIPILTIGALLSSLLARGLESAFAISPDFYAVILALGMAACIASLMKMPITAIAFAIEALGCGQNILHLVVVCTISYIITEMFGVKSINDKVIEDRIAEHSRRHPPKLIDTNVTIEKGSFAIGKEIRDIFWPAGLFVFSTTHKEKTSTEEHHEEGLRADDVLHIRYTTCDEEASQRELDAITKKY
jgi:H+/Cl- antiporter ClcA